MLRNKWSEGYPIREARYGHQCALLQDQIVIVGGMKENYGLNTLEIWKPIKGWAESHTLFGMKKAISYHGMLLHNQNLLIFGGRINKDENDDLYEIKLFQREETSSSANILPYRIKKGSDGPVVFKIPYGYLRNCKGMIS